MRFLALALVTSAAVVVAPAPALAKKKKKKPAVDRDTKRAMRFDKEGKKFYRAKRYEDAIAAFEAGYEIKPLPRLLFNIGRCHEKLDDLPKAVEHFERYRKVAETDEDVEDAETALGIVRVKLRKSRSPVSIKSRPAGARLRLEARSGAVIEAKTPYSDWLPFEWYRAQAWKEGWEVASKEFQVMQGESTRLSLELVRPAPEPAPAPIPPPVAQPTPEPEPTPEPSPPPQPQPAVAEAEPSPATEPPPPPPEPEPEAQASTAGWVALSAAVVLAGGAAYFGFGSTQEWIARDQLREERTNLDDIISHDEAAHTNALIANILWGLSAAALGTAAVTW